MNEQIRPQIKNQDGDWIDVGYGQEASEGYEGLPTLGWPIAIKMTYDGNITYIAIAKPGTTQATAAWQVKKINETTGLVITWADGDSKFNNVATDLTSLSYS